MSAFDRMKTRVEYKGYDLHDNFNVKRKYQSFLGALKNSYQAEWITLNKDSDNEKRWRCLINPSRLTEQFDKKILSIDFASGVQEGTIFWWDRTKKYWMINLQQHTEEAYFRGSITRADYEIEIDGKHYLAIARGPVEQTTDWQIKHQIIFNNLNYSLVLQVVKNSQTVNFFSRHQKVKIKLSYPDVDTGETVEEFHNWRVAATDKYSSDHLIDVYLKEDNDNEMEDNKKEPKEERIVEDNLYIDGPLTVYGYDTNIVYSVAGRGSGDWEISTTSLAKITDKTEDTCVIDILTGKPANFTLIYIDEDGTKIEQKIMIKSF